MGVAAVQRQSRAALHAALARSASYAAPGETDPVPTSEQLADGKTLTVRWHNKLGRAGSLEGGFGSEIIEGINRLVFSADELSVLGLTLVRGGVVTVPDLDASFELDAEEQGDGPLNVYWTVVKA